MVRGAGSPRGRSGGGARGDAGGERRRYSGEGAPRVATSGRRCLTPRPRLAPPKRTATMGRVGMWRGGGRLGMSVSAFVWRCLSGSTIAPFPHPSHRTQRADFPHCALGQGKATPKRRCTNGVGRQLHVVITEPLECLTHAPQFSKLGEHQLNRFADPSVGMKHNLSHEVLGIPNRKPFEQFTAARFGLLSR